MPIAFDRARWDRLKERTDRWWKGELDGPIIQCTLHGARDPGRPAPGHAEHFLPSYPEGTTPDEMVDRVDYGLRTREYLGDAFPHWWVNFGPGIVAGFLGGSVHPRVDPATVWFGPPDGGARELADYPDWTLDPGNPWFRRVAEVFRAAARRWEGGVQVGMTDLGGGLDVVSSFRPNEGLLYDLYDCPAEVLRRNDQVHDA